MTSRIVVFRGTTFLEIPTKNADGIDVRLTADGDALTVEVTKGEVLVHATGATQKELHYVTLGPGESATAAPVSARRSVLEALDWEHVDLRRGFIEIPGTKTAASGD